MAVDLRMCVCYRFLFADRCLVGAKVELAGDDAWQGVDSGCGTKISVRGTRAGMSVSVEVHKTCVRFFFRGSDFP